MSHTQRRNVFIITVIFFFINHLTNMRAMEHEEKYQITETSVLEQLSDELGKLYMDPNFLKSIAKKSLHDINTTNINTDDLLNHESYATCRTVINNIVYLLRHMQNIHILCKTPLLFAPLIAYLLLQVPQTKPLGIYGLLFLFHMSPFSNPTHSSALYSWATYSFSNFSNSLEFLLGFGAYVTTVFSSVFPEIKESISHASNDLQKTILNQIVKFVFFNKTLDNQIEKITSQLISNQQNSEPLRKLLAQAQRLKDERPSSSAETLTEIQIISQLLFEGATITAETTLEKINSDGPLYTQDKVQALIKQAFNKELSYTSKASRCLWKALLKTQAAAQSAKTAWGSLKTKASTLMQRIPRFASYRT